MKNRDGVGVYSLANPIILARNQKSPDLRKNSNILLYVKGMKTKPSNGFTLVELLVTMAVAAIVLASALPSFRETIMNNRRVTVINGFVGMLNLARSEAVKRGVDVTLCKSTDLATCGDGTVDWEDGWLLFVDDGATSGTVDAGEIIVRVHEALSTGVKLTGNGTLTTNISYQASGFSNKSGTFTLCDERGADDARAVIISSTGRPRTSDTQSDGSALTCS